ncbi:MAG: glycosyltransferase family 4 protein [Nitrospirota bacterium]
MRIVIVSQYFWPEAFRINDLAAGLKKQGHEVSVLTGFPNYPRGKLFPGYSIRLFQREQYEGVTVTRVPLYPDTSYFFLKRAWNHLSFMLSASLLGPFLVGRVDRIVVFQPGPITVGIPAIVLKYVKRAPILFWVQDIWPDTLEATGLIRRRWILRAVRWVANFVYRHCDVILVQSRGFIRRVAALGVHPGKVVYMPNWAEDLYRPVERDDELARKEEMSVGFHVVFAGNIGKAQDFDTLLAAAKLLRPYQDIRLIILGDGAMSEHYVQHARAEGLANVIFKGRKPLETMPSYFSLADVLLVLLKREPIFSLTIPSKLQSYMACGRPIVAAIEGDAAEIVRESGAGVVCAPGDPEGLAEAILGMYRLSPSQRESFGQSGLAYYRAHFDRAKMVGRFESNLADGGAIVVR